MTDIQSLRVVVVAMITDTTAKVESTGFTLNLMKYLLHPDSTLEYYVWTLDFQKRRSSYHHGNSRNRRYGSSASRITISLQHSRIYSLTKGTKTTVSTLSDDKTKFSFIRVILSTSNPRNIVSRVNCMNNKSFRSSAQIMQPSLAQPGFESQQMHIIHFRLFCATPTNRFAVSPC